MSDTPLPQPAAPQSSSVASSSRGSVALPVIPRASLPREPGTVVNPERRPHAVVELPANIPTSSVVRLLFPAPDGSIPDEQIEIDLGHFRLQQRIRSGGMGAVFRGLDTRLNRSVAIKILPPDQARDPASIQRFRNEAQAAAQLDHENIAGVYYIGEDQGLHFIAFEFIQGTNVRELIQAQGRLPVEDAVNYTLQVASALVHTYSHGVIHRDIKPSNIIITPQGRAKLVDLGLARQENSAAEHGDLTEPGTTLGTFDYISPEQAYDPRSVDVRSDIYSLGCTLYHMLTGEPPYPDGTVMQKLLQHRGDDSPNPQVKNRRVPDNLAAITRKMMAKDPLRRYQNADQLMRDLLVVAGMLGLRSISPEGLVWMSTQPARGPFWERHLAWISTLAALGLIVVWLEYGRPVNPPTGSMNLAESSATADPDAVPVQPSKVLNPTGESNDEPRTPPQKVAETRTQTKTLPDDIDLDPLPVSVATKKLLPPNLLETTPNNNSPIDFTLTANVEAAIGPQAEPFPELRPQALDAGQVHELGPRSIELATSTVPATKPPLPAESTTTKVPAVSSVPVASGDKPPAERPKDAATAQAPVWLVVRGMEQPFNSLASACAQAEDGATIELRYNGLRQEQPIRLNRKISIIAGKDFRPGIEFIARDELTNGYQTRMISLGSGALEMVGIDLSITVDPQIPAESWALFSLQRPDYLRLKGVTFTLRNPSRVTACLIELPGSPGGMMADMAMDVMSRPALEIELSGCFAHGWGDLVQVRTSDSIRISLTDSIVALQGTLLVSRGEPQSMRKVEDRIDLRLDQVTAALSMGLIRFDSGPQSRRFVPVQVNAANSIFTTPSGEPLVAMTGSTPAADFRRLLVWNGRKNFYDQYLKFWVIESSDSASSPESLDFRAWQKLWGPANEVDPQAEPVLWRHYWEGRNFSDLQAEDFALDRAGRNPAIAGGSTRNDAGASLETLERLGISLTNERR